MATANAYDASDVVGWLLSFFPLSEDVSPPAEGGSLCRPGELLGALYAETEALGSSLSVSVLVDSCLGCATAPVEVAYDFDLSSQRMADAREVLLFLLQNPPFFAIHDKRVALYAGVLKRVYRQLVVDSVRRKCRDAVRREDVSSGTTSTATKQVVSEGVVKGMNAWSRDLLQLVTNTVLPALIWRDADPQQVTSTFNINEEASPSDVSQSKEGESVNAECGEALVTLSALLLDISRTTTNTLQSPCQVGALAVYAALFASQKQTGHSFLPIPFLSPGCASVSFPTISTYAALLENADGAPLDTTDDGVSGADASFRFQTDAERILGVVAAVLKVGGGTELEAAAGESSGDWTIPPRVLRNLVGVLGEALTEKQGSGEDERDNGDVGCRDAVSNDEYLYEDCEQGLPRDLAKDAALHQERERARQALTIWPDSPTISSKIPRSVVLREGKFGSDTLALGLCGAVSLLVCQLLHDRTSSRTLSNSPASLLAAICEPLSTCLGTGNGVWTLASLLLLDGLAEMVNSGSLFFPGEDLGANSHQGLLAATLNSSPNKLEAHGVHQASRTRRYAVYFRLEKELITLSATCPLELNRNISRRLVVRLLDILEDSSRIQMQCSLLCLTPFAFVARSLLDNLLGQWKQFRHEESERMQQISSRQGAATGGVPAYAFDTTLPDRLATVASSLVNKVRWGHHDFVDTLIVLLNFFRVVIAAEQHSARKRLATDAERRVQVQASLRQANLVKSGWPSALLRIQRTLLPECEQLIRTATAAELDTVRSHPALALQCLSPLDQFSLTTAVESLSAMLTD